MNARIVIIDSYKQTAFKDTAKHAGKRWKNRRQPMRKFTTPKITLPKQRKIHIHHAMCGHGGERWVEGAPVDGYHHKTKTIFQYHGCPWNGCRKCFPQERNKVIGKGVKRLEDRFKATIERTVKLRKAGYRVIEAWDCEDGWIRDIDPPKEETKSYPHASFYDFETYGDDKKRKEVMRMLTIENEHVPISVSISDTLEREPTLICERDPAELVRKFVEELERRGKTIRAQVRAEVVPEDVHLLPKKAEGNDL